MSRLIRFITKPWKRPFTSSAAAISKTTLRGRFLRKLFHSDGDREALRTIYAALQIQYGQVEDKLHAVYSPFTPIVGYQQPDEKEAMEATLKKKNHEIIELDNEEEEAAAKITDEWVTRGSQFVNGILWFSKRSGYKACSIKDEIYAKQNHYRLTTPVKVDWDHFDHRILSKVRPYDTRYEGIDPPSFGHKAIILTRGEGLDSSRGFYFYEKFDEITVRYARRFIGSVRDNLRNFTGLPEYQRKLPTLMQTNVVREKFERTKNKVVTKLVQVRVLAELVPDNVASVAVTQEQQEQELQRNVGSASVAMDRAGGGEIDDGGAKRGHVHMLREDHGPLSDREEYNRNALSEIKFTFSNVLGRITLQEETFADTLAIYETRDFSEEKGGFERSALLENKRDIHLRHFQQVPKCDMEFVLPEDAQKVYMRPVDRLFLAMSIIGGTGLASGVYWTGLVLTHAGIVAATALGMYSVRIFNRYRLSKFYYRSAMAQYMSSNATGRDDSVIHIVTRDAQSHDFVAIASVLRAAWEVQRDEGTFMDMFKSGNSSVVDEAVELKRVQELAEEYFAKAESIKHGEGLGVHGFKNAVHWLVVMNIIHIKRGGKMTVVKDSDGILSMKKELLGDSLNEAVAMEALNATFLGNIENVEDII